MFLFYPHFLSLLFAVQVLSQYFQFHRKYCAVTRGTLLKYFHSRTANMYLTWSQFAWRCFLGHAGRVLLWQALITVLCSKTIQSGRRKLFSCWEKFQETGASDLRQVQGVGALILPGGVFWDMRDVCLSVTPWSQFVFKKYSKQQKQFTKMLRKVPGNGGEWPPVGSGFT